MPNSANRSKNSSQSNQGHAKDQTSKTSNDKPNPERSDLKQGREEGGSTNRTSNQGRKNASGGSAND